MPITVQHGLTDVLAAAQAYQTGVKLGKQRQQEINRQAELESERLKQQQWRDVLGVAQNLAGTIGRDVQQRRSLEYQERADEEQRQARLEEIGLQDELLGRRQMAANAIEGAESQLNQWDQFFNSNKFDQESAGEIRELQKRRQALREQVMNFSPDTYASELGSILAEYENKGFKNRVQRPKTLRDRMQEIGAEPLDENGNTIRNPDGSYNYQAPNVSQWLYYSEKADKYLYTDKAEAAGSKKAKELDPFSDYLVRAKNWTDPEKHGDIGYMTEAALEVRRSDELGRPTPKLLLITKEGTAARLAQQASEYQNAGQYADAQRAMLEYNATLQEINMLKQTMVQELQSKLGASQPSILGRQETAGGPQGGGTALQKLIIGPSPGQETTGTISPEVQRILSQPTMELSPLPGGGTQQGQQPAATLQPSRQPAERRQAPKIPAGPRNIFTAPDELAVPILQHAGLTESDLSTARRTLEYLRKKYKNAKSAEDIGAEDRPLYDHLQRVNNVLKSRGLVGG